MRFIRTFLPLLALVCLTAGSASAQALSALCPRMPVPFGPGEEAIYEVKFGFINVGEARLAVAGVDTIRGEPTYRLEMLVDASLGVFGRLKYDLRSWMDVDALVSRRYTRDAIEGRTPRRRFFDIFPEERRWERPDNGEKGITMHSCPQDDVSFIYYLRSQRFGVGDTWEGNRYFKEDGNPVKVSVTGRDRIETDAGTFNTIVMRPTIKTDGLFKEDGKAEIHLSDDAHRDLIYMRVEIPVAGSMTLRLKSIKRGTPLPLR
jgi:hypothetical protein